MLNPPNPSLLEALLDSWDRSNTILLNLLRIVPEGGLSAKATESSPTVAQMYAHLHYVRMVLVQEDAPECARPYPTKEERAPNRIPATSRNGSTRAPGWYATRCAAGWRAADTWTCTTTTLS